MHPSRRRLMVHGLSASIIAMAVATVRLRSGLVLIGDSGSYLAGAHGIIHGRFFETPLVPSFSELPVLETVRNGGWSPYADFGIGLPTVIALLAVVMPLTTAAGLVNVVSIGLIALGIVIGPWSPRRRSELWMRTVLAVAVSCWPILRFTSLGVLSEPLFCAGLLWLAIVLARQPLLRWRNLVGLGVLSTLIGSVRFIGPVVAIVVAVLLVQLGMQRRHALMWAVVVSVGPVATTFLLAGGTDARVLAFHGLDATDVFFTARGVGGWFEAGLGDQTSTLLRLDFSPSPIDWLITLIAAAWAISVVWRWSISIRRREFAPLQPALVLAVALAVAVIPSMLFLDVVLKLENRILMPSGLLVISAAGWSVARLAPRALAWGIVGMWTIVATHPWEWLDRPSPSAPTALTDAVEANDSRHVLTNNADLVWWITRTPARYLPDGYHDLSARIFDAGPVVAELACALARTEGVIVAERTAIHPDVLDQLTSDVSAGRYTRTLVAEIVTYMPTGLNC